MAPSISDRPSVAAACHLLDLDSSLVLASQQLHAAAVKEATDACLDLRCSVVVARAPLSHIRPRVAARAMFWMQVAANSSSDCVLLVLFQHLALRQLLALAFQFGLPPLILHRALALLDVIAHLLLLRHLCLAPGQVCFHLAGFGRHLRHLLFLRLHFCDGGATLAQRLELQCRLGQLRLQMRQLPRQPLVLFACASRLVLETCTARQLLRLLLAARVRCRLAQRRQLAATLLRALAPKRPRLRAASSRPAAPPPPSPLIGLSVSPAGPSGLGKSPGAGGMTLSEYCDSVAAKFALRAWASGMIRPARSRMKRPGRFPPRG